MPCYSALHFVLESAALKTLETIIKAMLKKLSRIALLTGATVIVAHAADPAARPDYILDKNKTFNTYTWLSSHNAFSRPVPDNPKDDPFALNSPPNYYPNNQLFNIKKQLEIGVRSLMLDVYMKGGEPYLCHKACEGHTKIPFVDLDNVGSLYQKNNFQKIQLLAELTPIMGKVSGDSARFNVGYSDRLSDVIEVIIKFLEENPNEVITWHLETPETSRTDWDNIFLKSQKLSKFIFNPARWRQNNEWPTLKEMIDSNQRLLIFTQRSDLKGDYSSGAHMMLDQEMTVENTFDIGSWPYGTYDWNCTSRWPNVPLNTSKTVNGWSRLFIMNQFRGYSPTNNNDTVEINGFREIFRRAELFCKSAAYKFPNYIAVDHVQNGAARQFVEWANNGGVIAGDRISLESRFVITSPKQPGAATIPSDLQPNAAIQSSSAVPFMNHKICGFSTSIARAINLKDSGEKIHGCDNDKINYLLLKNVKAGQRIKFFDSPFGEKSDDFTVLDIVQSTAGYIEIKDLERTENNGAYRMLYTRKNGLNGKVSRIEVEPRPIDMTIFEGENKTGNFTCNIPLNKTNYYMLDDLKGCNSARAKSLSIVGAKKGTTITLYQDLKNYLTIEVLKEIDSPFDLNNLYSNYTGTDVRVKYISSDGTIIKIKVRSVHVGVR